MCSSVPCQSAALIACRHYARSARNAGRFTLNIRHLSWHQTLPYLCISTDDGKLDVWWEESQGLKALNQLVIAMFDEAQIQVLREGFI